MATGDRINWQQIVFWIAGVLFTVVTAYMGYVVSRTNRQIEKLEASVQAQLGGKAGKEETSIRFQYIDEQIRDLQRDSRRTRAR